jgi:hypothetical protein
MNNSVTFVTCIYDDLFGTELGGRPHPMRKYYYGIESALKINSPFVIFAWEKDVNKIKSHFINFLGVDQFEKQIKVLPFDLYNTEIREPIKNQKLKGSKVPGDRCHDVMFGKFLMIQRAIKDNFFNSEKFFWIDAGLSSSTLFPNKHLDLSIPEKRYSWCYLFTPKVVDSLYKLSSDKVLLFKMNEIGYWFDKTHLGECDGTWFIIGGIFGGNKDDIGILCEKVLDSFIKHINDYSVLYTEEQILTIIYSFDKQTYNTIEFDVWHHEDSGDWVKDKIIGRKNFYKIFEEFNT